MAMGDLVLLEEELNPVMGKLRPPGFEITAVHKSTRHEPIFVRGIFLRNAGVFVRYIYVERYFLATPLQRGCRQVSCGT
jgi:Domain of Unknown Function (DUF1259)